MVQSDDFLDEKSLRKDQIEHAKMIYERNKEIYKYTFETMKFLDSKLTRAMTLITFMFTVQTGFITLVVARLESGLGKNFLILIAVFTFILLMFAMKKALNLSAPKPRSMLTTNQIDTDENLNLSHDNTTLEICENFSINLASVHEQLETRNFSLAQGLICIHNMLFSTYLLICLSALSVCVLNLKSS